MNRMYWKKICSIFDHVVDKTPSHRKDYIEMVCEDDVELKAQVESLLVANDAVFTHRLSSDQPNRHERECIKQLAEYKIVKELGRGGMGSVFHALDEANRDVAIKVLPPYLVNDEAAKKRFEQESRVLSSMQHESICQIIRAFCDESGRPCIAMELCHGKPLDPQMYAQSKHYRVILNTLTQIVDALREPHRNGIFHRDIKPENIMVSDDQKIKLIDFGVAKFADQKLTATGLVMGSPHYMSPEQWRGQKIDQRSDIWAVGALLYEMLSGEKAFVGETRVDVAIQVFEGAPKPIVFCDVNGAERKRAQQLEMISLKALRKAPDERYQDCSELLKELRSIG